MTTSDDQPLTPKQDAFVHWYTSPGDGLFNATEAAALAGYKGSRNTLSQVGRQNLRKIKIWRAIRDRINEMYSAANLTVDRVLNDIEMTRQMALADGKYSAALRASELHGKYLSMWIERIEHVHTIDDASTEDLVALAERLAGRIDGFDLNGGSGGDGSAPGADADPAGARTTH